MLVFSKIFIFFNCFYQNVSNMFCKKKFIKNTMQFIWIIWGRYKIFMLFRGRLKKKFEKHWYRNYSKKLYVTFMFIQLSWIVKSRVGCYSQERSCSLTKWASFQQAQLIFFGIEQAHNVQLRAQRSSALSRLISHLKIINKIVFVLKNFKNFLACSFNLFFYKIEICW